MIYHKIKEKQKEQKKQLAVLLDPNNYTTQTLHTTINKAEESNIDYFFVGGSLLSSDFDHFIGTLKNHTKIPIIIFPGSTYQISNKADAILFLSLISGRNPEYLIGNHVIAAPLLKKSKLEILPTSYILIGENNSTAVEYISNTKPIPSNKTEIITATAMAGEMLGHQLTYLEAGSGAPKTIKNEMIKTIKQNIKNPLIVGGGIKTPEQLSQIYDAGADLAVIGNILEKKLHLLPQFKKAAQYNYEHTQGKIEKPTYSRLN